MGCAGLQTLDPLCVVVRSIGSLGSSVTNSVFASVATAFGNTADSAINWLWSQMSSSTSIALGGATFELDLTVVASIAAVLCVGLFIVQMALSALKRDGAGIGRALRGLAIATVGCAITLATLDLLLAAVDQLCAGIVQLATGDSIATLGSKIIDPAVFTGLVAGPGAILILSLLAIGAVAIVWFALVVRKMLIIITAIFAPLAFAGGVADVSRGWVRKWLEGMLALVFSKMILILIFVIGLGVLGGMGSSLDAKGLSAITGDITGLLILLVAGFSPWMALKLVHFTGEHMATLSHAASHATSGAATVLGAPQKMASMQSSSRRLGGSTPGSPTNPGAVVAPVAKQKDGHGPSGSGASDGVHLDAKAGEVAGGVEATSGPSLATRAAPQKSKESGGTESSSANVASGDGVRASRPQPTVHGESPDGVVGSEGPLSPTKRAKPATPVSNPARRGPSVGADDNSSSVVTTPGAKPQPPRSSFPSSVLPLRFSGPTSEQPEE